MGTNNQEAAKFAEILKVNLKGLSEYDGIIKTLKAIKRDYEDKKTSLSAKQWKAYRQENMQMISWFMSNYEAYKLGGVEKETEETEEPDDDFKESDKKPVTVEAEKKPKPKPKKKAAKKPDKKKPEKEKKAAKKPDKKKPKKEKELSCWGHDKHSRRGFVDEALNKGTKRKTIVANLVAEFDTTPEWGNKILDYHKKWLERKCKIKFTESKSHLMKGIKK